jgi:uncharacterized protein YjbI with pentapeptide repeats
VDSSAVGYDGSQNVRDEELSVWQTKPERGQKEETKQSRWGFRGKTVWDWMALLIVPLVLVVIGLVFTMLQDARQQDLENQRAEAERELAEQRAQDEALQAYLDQMSELILERNLLESEAGDPTYTLAQARTSTVILRLDAEHNESVTRFLSDSGLAVRGKASAKLLEGIVLSHATLSDADLRHANLSRTDLSDANLRDANLRDADLRGANLSDADLSRADLSFADLSNTTNLFGADLSGANLYGATGWTEDHLSTASTLKGATMPNGQKYED